MTDIAVLGAGRMGTALVSRLAAGGHQVQVWSRTAEHAYQAASAAGQGVTATDDVATAVASADVVLSSLADGPATCEVLLNTRVLDAVKPGQLVCDLGTSGVDSVQRMERVLREREARFVDAPVSGSVPTVQAGRLLVMAGGSAADVADLTPVLAPVAASVIHVGEVGAGQAMKLAVNLIVYATNAAISEALVLAETAGISRKVAYDVLSDSVVSSPFLTYKRAAFLDDDEPVAMSLALVNKDLVLISALAHELAVSQPVTTAVAQRVKAACTQGYAANDMASLGRFSPRSPT